MYDISVNFNGPYYLMRFVAPVRRSLGVRTAFNLLGPLTNPAGVRRLMVGSGDPAAAPKLAEVLRLLGDERAFVVTGAEASHLAEAAGRAVASQPQSALVLGSPRFAADGIVALRKAGLAEDRRDGAGHR